MRSRSTSTALALAAVVSLGGAAASFAGAAATPAAGGPNPANFVDEVDNQYFPLEPGTTYTYRGTRDGQPTRTVVTVTDKTIVIQGVTCTVVHDDLFVAGRLAETTDDYYAQDRQDNVRYFGEDTKELDARGNVVSTEGTWRAGVQGAQSGIIMLGHPRVGQSYREEFFKGHAEDRAQVLSLSASVTVPFGTFHDVLQTKNTTPLHPDVVENKYYGKDVGLVHEQDVKGGNDSSDLVSVTPAANGNGNGEH
jgi:hypothetical protein